jgi:hypothetical protein
LPQSATSITSISFDYEGFASKEFTGFWYMSTW